MTKGPPPKVVEWIEKAREGLLTARNRMVPAQIGVLDFVRQAWSFQVAYALVELELPDALRRGPREADELARELGLDPDRVYRLLRAGTQIEVVREEPGRRFALRPLGEALCKDETGSFRDFLIFVGRHGLPLWSRLHDCVREGRTAVDLVHGKGPFEWLAANPSVEADFNRAMTAVSNVMNDPLVDAYEFSKARRIVDVGGGHGRLLGGVLRRAPEARGVLFDLPSVVEGAGPILDRLGVRDRVEVVGGDFFAEVPKGGDLYMMKTIIHDWPDAEAQKILRNIRSAIPSDGRLLLFEMIIPGPNEKHFSKFLDIEMIITAGGRERTVEEYASLFGAAGFRLTQVFPTASAASIIEAAPT